MEMEEFPCQRLQQLAGDIDRALVIAGNDKRGASLRIYHHAGAD